MTLRRVARQPAPSRRPGLRRRRHQVAQRMLVSAAALHRLLAWLACPRPPGWPGLLKLLVHACSPANSTWSRLPIPSGWCGNGCGAGHHSRAVAASLSPVPRHSRRMGAHTTTPRRAGWMDPRTQGLGPRCSCDESGDGTPGDYSCGCRRGEEVDGCVTVRARPGRLRSRSVLRRSFSLYGGFVWASRVPNRPNRPARAAGELLRWRL
jgi:hypothetical protein